MLREVFRYELGYRLRSRSTWAYAAFLFALGFFILHGVPGRIILVNAPANVAEAAAMFCGTFGMLVTAAFFADAAIRDVQVGMDQFLYTTPLRKTEYLGGRFLAALAVNALLLLAIPLGLAAATLMPYQDSTHFGPFRVAVFVQPYLLFLLPNVILAGAVFFTIGALTRQSIPVYVGGIGLFIAYLIAGNYWGSIGSPTVSVLADALGINALRGMTQ